MQIADIYDMKDKIQTWLTEYRHMDWAVLYLRMFIGSMMLFHNIGKMQDYNEIINSYPAILNMSSDTIFIIISTVEVLFSVLLMMGLFVRFSAVVLSVSMFVALMSSWVVGSERILFFLAIYIFITISGGGLYSLDAAMISFKAKK